MLYKLPGFGPDGAEKNALARRMQFTIDFSYEQMEKATDPIKKAGVKPDEIQEFAMIRNNPDVYMGSAKWIVKKAMDEYGIDEDLVDFRPPEERLGAPNTTYGLRRSDFRR